MEVEFLIKKEDYISKVNVFQGQPPTFPQRPVVAHIEFVAKSIVSIVFAGNTKPFAKPFDEMGIGPSKGAPLGGSHFAEWYRVVKRKDISDNDIMKEVIGIFQEKILKDSPAFVRIKNIPEEDSVYKKFVHALKDCIRVHILH